MASGRRGVLAVGADVPVAWTDLQQARALWPGALGPIVDRIYYPSCFPRALFRSGGYVQGSFYLKTNNVTLRESFSLTPLPLIRHATCIPEVA